MVARYSCGLSQDGIVYIKKAGNMNSKVFRSRKSQWALSSFYFFSFFFLISYATVFSQAIFFGLKDALELEATAELFVILSYSLKVASLSLLLSLPVALACTIFLVLCDGLPVGKFYIKVVRFLIKIPLL